VSQVFDDGGSIPHHDGFGRHVEFARPFAHGTEHAHEVAGRIEHHDARVHPAVQAVDDVEVSVGIEGDRRDVCEHLPVLAIEHADPEDLLEVGVERPVAAGEVDDFLGREAGRGGEDGEDGQGGYGYALADHARILLWGRTPKAIAAGGRHRKAKRSKDF